MSTTIKAGDHVLALTAFGEWKPGVADSEIEGTHKAVPEDGRMVKIHDFPVIWVKFEPDGRRVPWPAQDVRLVKEGESQ